MYAPGISKIRNIGYRDRTVGMSQGVYHSKVALSTVRMNTLCATHTLLIMYITVNAKTRKRNVLSL